MTIIPPPPAASTWDLEDVFAQTLAVLRLGQGDVDEDRVGRAVTVACSDVDSRVDRLESIAPTPRMVETAIARAVQWYRSKDAPFGVADSWSTDTAGGVNAGGDPLDNVLPDKERWGLA